ncbi:hypothetical protein ACO1PF_08240 [Alkalibacterium sp. f15]
MTILPAPMLVLAQSTLKKVRLATQETKSLGWQLTVISMMLIFN